MMLSDKPYTFDRVVRICISVFLFIIITWLLSYLSEVLIPFAIAFLIAYLINPLVCLIQRKIIKNRLVAVLLSLTLVFGTIIGTATIIFPMIGSEVQHMATLISQIGTDSESSLNQRAEEILPQTIWDSIKDFLRNSQLKEYLKSDRFIEMAQETVRKIMPIGYGIFSGAFSIIIGLIGTTIILLYLVFLLLDYQKVREDWKQLIPPNLRPAASEFARDFNTV